MKLQKYKIKNLYDNKLKNRYGRADVNKGVVFYGEIGMFKELPKPEEISDYSKYLILEKTKKDDLNTLDENENNNVFKF